VGGCPAIHEELAALVPASVREQLLCQVEPRLEREELAERLGQLGRRSELLDRGARLHPTRVAFGERELDPGRSRHATPQ
jgi:hypothetical protein